MKRNPRDLIKMSYFNNLKIRKFTPWLFYYKCDKCGNEYKRELMYQCSEPSIVGVTWNYYTRGCSHCFANEFEFRKWLEETGKILSERDFEDGTDSRRLLF